MRLIYGLSGARLEKAVGRQGGDAGLQVEGFGHASVWRGLRFLTCKRFFGSATVGAVSKRFLPALLDARYGVGNRLFPGEIIVTEMEESSQVVGMNHWNR